MHDKKLILIFLYSSITTFVFSFEYVRLFMNLWMSQKFPRLKLQNTGHTKLEGETSFVIHYSRFDPISLLLAYGSDIPLIRASTLAPKTW